jgi:hypothetical protein
MPIHGNVWIMSWFRRKKLPNRLFMIYTAFAMAGAFSFMMTESLRSLYFETRYQAQDQIYSSLQDYYIECPAEEPTLATAKGNGSLPRGGLQRCISPWALPHNGVRFSGPSLEAIVKTRFFNVKNTIRLKLRI